MKILVKGKCTDCDRGIVFKWVEKEVTRGLNDRLLKKPYKINDYESVPCPICDGGKKTEIERWEEINSLSDFKRLLGDTHTYGI